MAWQHQAIIWTTIDFPHWGRVTPIYVGKLTMIDLDNGLSPGGRQAAVFINAGILLIQRLEIEVSKFFYQN